MIWLYVAAGAVFSMISVGVGLASTLAGYFVIMHDPLHVQLQYPLILDYEPFAKILLRSKSSKNDKEGWTYRNMPSAISKAIDDTRPGLDEDSLIFINPPRPHSAVSWTHIGNNNTQPILDSVLRNHNIKTNRNSAISRIIKRSNQTMVQIQFDYDRFTVNKKWWDSCTPPHLCEDDHPIKIITVHVTVYDHNGQPYAASNVAHHATPSSWAQSTLAALPIESLVDYIVDLGWCRSLVRRKILLFPRLRLIEGSEYFRIRITSNIADPSGHYALLNPMLLLDVSTSGLRGLIRRHSIIFSLLIGLVIGVSCLVMGIGLIVLLAIGNAHNRARAHDSSRAAARIRHRNT